LNNPVARDQKSSRNRKKVNKQLHIN